MIADSVREDFDLLLEALTSMATGLLPDQGGFLPIAAVVSRAGEIAYVAAQTDEEQAGAPAVLELLETALREQALGDVRAIGTCVDVRLVESKQPFGDAMRVHVEHDEGPAADALLPYALAPDGDVTFGEWEIVAVAPRILSAT